MIQGERQGRTKASAKNRSSTAGRWVMLGLIGAGAAAFAARQANQRKTYSPDASDNAARQTDAESQPHYVGTVGEPILTQPESKPGISSVTPEAGSKMSDDTPMRGRDFPGRSRAGLSSNRDAQPLIVDQHQMEPEAIAAGGAIGEIEGDKQSFGEVPTIIDQNEATPNLT